MRSRGWWVGWILLVACAAAACAGGGDDANHNPGELYPDRANQYREDQERRIGEPVMLGGYTATVTEAGLDDDGRLMEVHVEITNRDEEAQRVDSTQWTLVNPRVQTLEATRATFASTELAGGETVSAVVSFAVDPDEVGEYYVQYKPENLDAARGIWQVVTASPPGSDS